MTNGAHVEAVQSESVPSLAKDGGTSRPASGVSVEQPVEAAPFITDVNLYDVLVAIARADSEMDPERHKDGYWHPSSFSKCDRAMVMEHAGRNPNKHSDETVLLFWIGHVIHDAVQKATTKNMPGIIWHEIAVEDETFKVRGHMDSLRMVRMPDDSFEVMFEVYEYKSVRTNAFNFKMPYQSHVLQVALYLTFPVRCPKIAVANAADLSTGGAPHGPACDVCGGSGVLPLPRRGRIAYIGKEDGMIKTYTVRNDPELREQVYAKLRSLEQQYQTFVATGVLPDKLSKVQTFIKGEPQVYVRGNSKKGIKVGDPKLEDDHRTYNCDYKGQGVCCADKEGK